MQISHFFIAFKDSFFVGRFSEFFEMRRCSHIYLFIYLKYYILQIDFLSFSKVFMNLNISGARVRPACSKSIQMLFRAVEKRKARCVNKLGLRIHR